MPDRHPAFIIVSLSGEVRRVCCKRRWVVGQRAVQMRRSVLVAAVLVLSISVLSAGQRDEKKYRTYHNIRFGYSISYPADILIPQGEAENGDGQKFLSRDGRTEMLVYGSHNSNNQTLRQVYEEETAPTPAHPNRVVTYQVLRRNWFVASGVAGDKVFYQKTFLKKGIFKTFRIEYDQSESRVYNPVTAKISGSFKG